MSLQTSTLPPPKLFLKTLISSLLPVDEPQQASSNPLSISSHSKSTLLTLHAVFPTILLPALDLLDRRLITRLILQDDSTTKRNIESNDQRVPKRSVYYVRSNAHRDGRSRYSRGDIGATSYEVRTKAWSCTCAAFAFSALSQPGSSPTYENHDYKEDTKGDNTLVDDDEEMLDVPEHHEAPSREVWQWGGLTPEAQETSVCKHLLACLLAEWWDVAQAMAEERAVGFEEMAGWAAGGGG